MTSAKAPALPLGDLGRLFSVSVLLVSHLSSGLFVEDPSLGASVPAP